MMALPWIVVLLFAAVGSAIKWHHEAQEREQATRDALFTQCARYNIVPPANATTAQLREWLAAAQDRRIAMFANRRRTDTLRSRGTR